MIVISKSIAGLPIYTSYRYDKFTEDVKLKMLELRMEDGVDKVNALYQGQLIAFTTKSMNYVRLTDLGESIYEV